MSKEAVEFVAIPADLLASIVTGLQEIEHRTGRARSSNNLPHTLGTIRANALYLLDQLQPYDNPEKQ